MMIERGQWHPFQAREKDIQLLLMSTINKIIAWFRKLKRPF
jgi:hypothetical protein